jgi:hypothetical protein
VPLLLSLIATLSPLEHAADAAAARRGTVSRAPRAQDVDSGRAVPTKPAPVPSYHHSYNYGDSDDY